MDIREYYVKLMLVVVYQSINENGQALRPITLTVEDYELWQPPRKYKLLSEKEKELSPQNRGQKEVLLLSGAYAPKIFEGSLKEQAIAIWETLGVIASETQLRLAADEHIYLERLTPIMVRLND